MRRSFASFLLLTSTIIHGQDDFGVLTVDLKKNSRVNNLYIISGSFISKSKSPIATEKKVGDLDVICGFSDRILVLQKLEDDCYKKISFDCTPSLAIISGNVERQELYFNDTISFQYELPDKVYTSKGIYRLKIIFAFYHVNPPGSKVDVTKPITIMSKWIYINTNKEIKIFSD